MRNVFMFFHFLELWCAEFYQKGYTQLFQQTGHSVEKGSKTYMELFLHNLSLRLQLIYKPILILAIILKKKKSMCFCKQEFLVLQIMVKTYFIGKISPKLLAAVQRLKRFAVGNAGWGLSVLFKSLWDGIFFLGTLRNKESAILRMSY